MNYTILDLPPEIIEIIVDNLDLESQINFVKTCKFFNNISGKCSIKTKGIYKLSKLTRLDMRNNHEVKNLSYLTQIKYLDISENCDISKDSIKHLNLDKLVTFNDKNFKDNKLLMDQQFYNYINQPLQSSDYSNTIKMQMELAKEQYLHNNIAENDVIRDNLAHYERGYLDRKIIRLLYDIYQQGNQMNNSMDMD